MKKHLSVFMLSASFAFWPTLIVSLLGAAGSFAWLYSLRGSENSNYMLGSELFSQLMIPVYVGVALLFIMLTLNMRERGGVQPGYTLRRLGVDERTVFIWQAVVGALSFFIFMMFQAAVCFFYGLWLQNQGLGVAGNLSVLVGFVNGLYTHAMLPLGDLPVYLRMLVVYLTLGAAVAYASFMGRRGKTAISPFVVLAAALVLMAFQAQVASYTYEVIAIGTGAIICWCFWASISGRLKDGDNEAVQSPQGGTEE